MEFYKTDDVALELSTIIEDLSETNCENVNIPHKGPKSPAVYKQIMKTKFPPNSPTFVKPEQNANISTDSKWRTYRQKLTMSDVVSILYSPRSEVLKMNDVDGILYYPKLDNLHPSASDKEKSAPDKAEDKEVNVDRSNNLEHNSEVGYDPSISEAVPSSQETVIDYQTKDDNTEKANSDAHPSQAEDSIDNQSAAYYENGEPYDSNLKGPFVDDSKESKDEILISDPNMEENPDAKSEEESKGREDDIPKSSYISPCCFGTRSDSNEARNDDTEYEPKTIENDSESDLHDGEMEYEKVSIENNEEKEQLRNNSEYEKFNIESEEEKLLPSDKASEDTEWDVSNMKINEANKNQEPENHEFSYENLEEQLESDSIIDSKFGGQESSKNLSGKNESDSPSNFQMTPLDTIEDQDNLLQANDLKKKKKSSIFKKLFSKKRN